MRKSKIIVQQMDCPSEEQIIKMKLGAIEEVKSISFDLANRRVEVVHCCPVQVICDALDEVSLPGRIERSEDNYVFSTEENINSIADERKTLVLLLTINASMFLIEFFIGLFSESLGVLADSLDMLADASVYSISLLVVGKSASRQARAAKVSGILQIALAIWIAFEAVRRFFYTTEPNIGLMIGISILALVANGSCLFFLNKHKNGGNHMKASWIFSINDMVANLGVIIAAILVYFTQSNIPDLVIGLAISVFVMRGAKKILNLST